MSATKAAAQQSIGQALAGGAVGRAAFALGAQELLDGLLGRGKLRERVLPEVAADAAAAELLHTRAGP